VVEYDPFLFYEDPYPVYRRLRDEAPVYLNRERSIWVLSRFDDVQRAGRDWRTFSSGEGVDIDDSRLGPGSFLDADPPRHDELRKILHADFAPASLGRLEPLIAAKVDTLVGSLLERGQVDLVGELARRLPVFAQAGGVRLFEVSAEAREEDLISEDDLAILDNFIARQKPRTAPKAKRVGAKP
jgi:cytochrome P450